jgi:hypothetical protein
MSCPCKSNAVTEKTPPSEAERLAEIDYRVAARLAMFQDRNAQYQRGFWDAIYVIGIFLAVAYCCYVVWQEREQ